MTYVCVAKYEVLSLYLLGQAEKNKRKLRQCHQHLDQSIYPRPIYKKAQVLQAQKILVDVL